MLAMGVAAPYPPLQKAQGRGTHFYSGIEQYKGRATHRR